MKNLKKNFSLTIVIFSAFILLSSVFSEKAMGADPPQCDSFGTGLSCHALGNISDGCQDSTKPTMCISTRLFIGAYRLNGKSVVCCNVPLTPTPTPASTQPTCVSRTGFYSGLAGTFECCSGLTKCPSTRTCETSCATPTPNPASTVKLVWQKISDCPVPTPASTTSSDKKKLGQLCFQTSECGTGLTCGDYNERDQGSCLAFVPSPTNTLTPTNTPTPTPTLTPKLFVCEGTETAIGFEGVYQCADIKNENTPRCPSGYGPYNPPSPYTGTSCDKNNQGCCKLGAPTATPTPTPTITPTPLPGSVQLNLSVFLPRMIGKELGENNKPLIKNNRAVKVILKSSTNQTIEKSATVDYSVDSGKYTGIINLGPVPSGIYKSIVKMGNFLVGRGTPDFSTEAAKDPIEINAGLVVGLDDDLNLNIAYYNVLVSCFGSTIGHPNPKCNNVSEADLNGDGAVDAVDYSIFLRTLKEIVVR